MAGKLDYIQSKTELNQDIDLATIIAQLSRENKLTEFINDQQTRIYQDIVKQKDTTFQNVYGNLQNASKAQSAILMLDKRNNELANIQNQIIENQEKSAGAITEDKNLAERKYEMNQWTVSNKNDTLFIFSSLFILLSSLILLTFLLRKFLISSEFYGSLSGILILIFILMVIYRANFTNIWRNNRYWNRRNFDGKYGKIPVPQCSDISQAATSAADMANQAFNSLRG